jgi:hypothetical protein
MALEWALEPVGCRDRAPVGSGVPDVSNESDTFRPRSGGPAPFNHSCVLPMKRALG